MPALNTASFFKESTFNPHPYSEEQKADFKIEASSSIESEKLAAIYTYLQEFKLDTAENYNLLKKNAQYADEIFHGFNLLKWLCPEYDVTQADYDFLMQRPAYADLIGLALNNLKPYQVDTTANLELIIKYAHIEDYVIPFLSVLSNLKTANLATEENCNFFRQDTQHIQYILSLSRVLRKLNHSRLLTLTNYQCLMTYRHSLKQIEEKLNLFKRRLSQDIFDEIIGDVKVKVIPALPILNNSIGFFSNPIVTSTAVYSKTDCSALEDDNEGFEMIFKSDCEPKENPEIVFESEADEDFEIVSKIEALEISYPK